MNCNMLTEEATCASVEHGALSLVEERPRIQTLAPADALAELRSCVGELRAALTLSRLETAMREVIRGALDEEGGPCPSEEVAKELELDLPAGARSWNAPRTAVECYDALLEVLAPLGQSAIGLLLGPYSHPARPLAQPYPPNGWDDTDPRSSLGLAVRAGRARAKLRASGALEVADLAVLRGLSAKNARKRVKSFRSEHPEHITEGERIGSSAVTAEGARILLTEPHDSRRRPERKRGARK